MLLSVLIRACEFLFCDSVVFKLFSRIIIFTFRKVYVQFQNDTQLTTVNVNGFQTVMGAPGKIPKEVYLAVRRRQLGIQSHIKVMA